MKTACVLGSCVYDLRLEVGDIPSAGRTVFADSISETLGGKGYNQASVLNRLGVNVFLMSAVGDDWRGRAFFSELDKLGVSTRYMMVAPEGATGQAVPIVTPSGEKSFIVHLGANTEYDSKIVEEARIQISQSDFCIAQTETSLASFILLKNICKSISIPFICNAAPSRDLFRDHINNIDYLIVNRHEAEWLANIPIKSIADAKMVVRWLRNGLSVASAIITLGREGVVFTIADKVHYIPAIETTLIDPVGAGDAFVAGFSSAICDCHDIGYSVGSGIQSATLACEKLGGGAI